jgi:hypothetical protein
MLQDVQKNAGFLCDKAALLGGRIKGTFSVFKIFCVKIG